MSKYLQRQLCYAIGDIKYRERYYSWWDLRKRIVIPALKDKLTRIFFLYEAEAKKASFTSKKNDIYDSMMHHMCDFIDEYFTVDHTSTCNSEGSSTESCHSSLEIGIAHALPERIDYQT